MLGWEHEREEGEGAKALVVQLEQGVVLKGVSWRSALSGGGIP